MATNARSNRGSLEARMGLWRKRFQDFSSGAGTVEQFCNRLGVTPATFYYWRKKLVDAGELQAAPSRSASDKRLPASGRDRQEPLAAALPTGFMQVRVARSAVADGEVVIRLPSGAQVQIPVSASQAIAAVIAQVYGLGGCAVSEVA